MECVWTTVCQFCRRWMAQLFLVWVCPQCHAVGCWRQYQPVSVGWYCVSIIARLWEFCGKCSNIVGMVNGFPKGLYFKFLLHNGGISTIRRPHQPFQEQLLESRFLKFVFLMINNKVAYFFVYWTMKCPLV